MSAATPVSTRGWMRWWCVAGIGQAYESAPHKRSCPRAHGHLDDTSSDPALALLGLSRSVMTLEGMNASHFFCQDPQSYLGGGGLAPLAGSLGQGRVKTLDRCPWAWPSTELGPLLQKKVVSALCNLGQVTHTGPWFPHLESRGGNGPTPQSCVTLNELAFTKAVGEDLARGEDPTGLILVLLWKLSIMC